MNPLSTREDLLASHEHVIRVGPLVIVGVGHRVEWADCKWELVENVEVSVVAGLD